MEIEEAYTLSHMPLLAKQFKTAAHSRSNSNGLNKAYASSVVTYKGSNEIRTLEQFMEDQIKYEHKKYENLKNRIIKEEEDEMKVTMPKPIVNKKSLAILNKVGYNNIKDTD